MRQLVSRSGSREQLTPAAEPENRREIAVEPGVNADTTGTLAGKEKGIAMYNSPYTHAAATAANTFVYYALPDVIRTPALRRLARLATVGAMTAVEVTSASPELAKLRDSLADGSASSAATGQTTDTLSAPKIAIAAGLGVVALFVGVSVAAEKAIFRRGERKRAGGDHFAHTKQALVISALIGTVTAAIDKYDTPDANHPA